MTIADEPGDGPHERRRSGASPHDPSVEGGVGSAAGPVSPGPASPDPAPPEDEGVGGADPAPLDYDARFADIVARWSDQPEAPASAEGVGTQAHRLDRADVDGDDPDSQRHASERLSDGPGGGREPGSGVNPPLSPVPWRQHTPPPEPEEDFRPAAPAPLPRGDLGFWGALLGVTLGPLWLIYLVVTNPYGSRLEMGLALLMAVGGFALIVARLPRRHQGEDRDDADDDGAVV